MNSTYEPVVEDAFDAIEESKISDSIEEFEVSEAIEEESEVIEVFNVSEVIDNPRYLRRFRYLRKLRNFMKTEKDTSCVRCIYLENYVFDDVLDYIDVSNKIIIFFCFSLISLCVFCLK